MGMDIVFSRAAFPIVIVFLTVKLSESLECYSCTSVAAHFACNQSVTCGQNEFCFLEKNETTYVSGCATSEQCSASSGVSGVLVGRQIWHEPSAKPVPLSALSVRETSSCHECCSTDYCNANMCTHLKPSACTDDETVDCARMNTLFSICNDIQKAKPVCPKYCKLCSLVDGQWAAWPAWSPCSVTCGNGSESRTRTCSNPPPANGGLDCVGASTDTKPCSLEACPVHGEWSMWSEWGSCSVSCDVGMQRRDRSCSNPYPSPDGTPCFGESKDDRLCLPGACADGFWSNWGTWSTCSDSCGGGVKSRERTCTNPPPSPYGRYCNGSSVQTMLCNKQSCTDDRVAFTAYGISSESSSELIFPHVLLNQGNGYSPATGRFTCTVPGLYFFISTLSKQHFINTDLVQCFLKVNSNQTVGSIADPYGSQENDFDGYVVTISGTFHLNQNDYVHIGSCSGTSTLFQDNHSSFSGFLIAPDVK